MTLLLYSRRRSLTLTFTVKHTQGGYNGGTEIQGDLSRPITVIVVSARPDWPLCSGPVGGRYFKLLLTEVRFISESDSTGVEAGQ